MADLWMTGNKTEWSFVRRWSTEPFFPVFGCGYLLSSSPCSRDDLIRNSVPSLLPDPGGNLATPDRNNDRELNHPSSIILYTA